MASGPTAVISSCIRGRGPADVSSALSQSRYERKDRKPARNSSVNSFGCSQAAKWPPLSSLL